MGGGLSEEGVEGRVSGEGCAGAVSGGRWWQTRWPWELCHDWLAGQVCEASGVLIGFLAAGAEVLGRGSRSSWTCQNLETIIMFLFIGGDAKEH